MAQPVAELAADVRPLVERVHLVHADALQLLGDALEHVEQADRLAVGQRDDHVGPGPDVIETRSGGTGAVIRRGMRAACPHPPWSRVQVVPAAPKLRGSTGPRCGNGPMAAPPRGYLRDMAGTDRLKLVIAGGGVGGVELLLAVQALAADRVAIESLAPEPHAPPLSITEPFRTERPSASCSPRSPPTGRAHVPGCRRTRRHRCPHRPPLDGARLDYDVLMLALGARPAEAIGGAPHVPRLRDASTACARCSTR